MSEEGNTGTFFASVTFTTVAIALAIVLSIGINIASVSAARASVTCWISFVFATVDTFTSKPNSFANFSASCACFTELSSLAV